MIIFAWQRIDTRYGMFDLKLFKEVGGLAKQLKSDGYKQIAFSELKEICMNYKIHKWIDADYSLKQEIRKGIMFKAIKKED